MGTGPHQKGAASTRYNRPTLPFVSRLAPSSARVGGKAPGSCTTEVMGGDISFRLVVETVSTPDDQRQWAKGGTRRHSEYRRTLAEEIEGRHPAFSWSGGRGWLGRGAELFCTCRHSVLSPSSRLSLKCNFIDSPFPTKILEQKKLQIVEAMR